MKPETQDSIHSEQDYQKLMSQDPERPDMVNQLSVGETLLAMQVNLDKAKSAWYSGAKPHTDSMEFVRKIIALGCTAGDNFGIPKRELPNNRVTRETRETIETIQTQPKKVIKKSPLLTCDCIEMKMSCDCGLGINDFVKGITQNG